MRIQHNIMAMNAYRNYTSNTSALAKNLEKLSSGYKINRAGDDAAGLAISEKMRAQITGLKAAQKNAKDGISLVQTAEGALTEVHDMLNRMVDLADQSANGTYDDETDRANLQKEFDALRTEIDRIADSSNFNGIKLLDGSMGGGQVGAEAAVGTTLGATGTTSNITLTGLAAGKSVVIKSGDTEGVSGNTITLKKGTAYDQAALNRLAEQLSGDAKGAKLTLDKEFTTNATADTTGKTLSAAEPAYAKATAGGIDFVSTKAGNITNKIKIANIDNSMGQSAAINDGGDIVLQLKGNETVDDINKLLSKAGIDLKATKVGTLAQEATGVALAGGAGLGGNGLTLQIGDTAESFNQLTVSIADMHAQALGLSNISIADQDSAKSAIDAIKSAINSVSSTRGGLGALQNRLDHTISNLSVMQENIQDAEANIRDVDVAEEMMAYTKNNILVQSAQAMLAQANQIPQGVLQLLQ
ncbi:flagellin [Oscillospiraceae bacterium]|nr:flagellin [Oscillospiraceae bacterium]BDF76476.1 flagellin [Oscillospiraceae bacterium]